MLFVSVIGYGINGSPGGVKYIAPYIANKHCTYFVYAICAICGRYVGDICAICGRYVGGMTACAYFVCAIKQK